MKFQKKHLWPLTAIGVATAAVAATVITLQPEIAVSTGGSGHKPKIQRAGADGTLVMAYGDTFTGAQTVYDTKAQAERLARDIFVRTCKPTPATDTTTSPRITCDAESEWSAPINVSNSANKYSVQTAWRGGDPVTGRLPFYGDIDKPNIKTSGPVMVLTWTSKYCPDSDVSDGVAPVADGSVANYFPNPSQRAIRYLDRGSRIVPFSCTWMAVGRTNGTVWGPAIQLSNGERDAKQDASSGTYLAPNARIAVSWQEDPEGLQPGDADGPGDGASGANVTGGTDVWYTSATFNNGTGVINFATPAAPTATTVPKVTRLTDNWDGGYGLSGQISHVFAADGSNLDGRTAGQEVEKGNAGASRPNIGVVNAVVPTDPPRTVLAWEETKGGGGLASGKFVRYLSFPYNNPPLPAGTTFNDSTTTLTASAGAYQAGCVISNPQKNARRVRFLTQDEAAAPAGGVNIAIFWKEGSGDKGAPSDIVVRRGMGGLQPSDMQPVVASTTCATSTYDIASTLPNALPENISSRAPNLSATDSGLGDDTEINRVENALAHRGVLRGNELWIGYNYTNDLVKMWAQLDNYNFWVRKYTFDNLAGTGSWGLPYNITNITDTRINVREPRFFGTPPSQPAGCPTGNPTDPTTLDATLCQAKNVIFVAYGSQENVSPFDPDGGDDLGIYLTVSKDGGQTFIPSVQYSAARGSLFDDEDFAFEAQLVARPDGGRVYGAFNTEVTTTGLSAAAYRSALVTEAPDAAPTGGGGGGCSAATGERPVDPVLPLLAAIGLLGLGVRRARKV
ncbi:MAG: choice-of-anchor O protein [Hydrogenophaga sp.]|nr:choice-of-anchor O protein [Hydrogenophaga sp.]